MKRLATLAGVAILAWLGCTRETTASPQQPGGVAAAAAAPSCGSSCEQRTYEITKTQLDDWFVHGAIGKDLYKKLGSPDTSQSFAREQSRFGHKVRLEWDKDKGTLRFQFTGLFRMKAVERIDKDIKVHGAKSAAA